MTLERFVLVGVLVAFAYVLVTAPTESGCVVTKTHIAAIKDQLTSGRTNMTPAQADALLYVEGCTK